MKYIFVTAYDDFSDYELLRRIYDKLLSKTNKIDLCFYCTIGSSGDNTCAKYIRKNGMQMIDWLNPRKGKTIKEERKKMLLACDYAIIIENGYHKGMITAADQSMKYVKKQVVIIDINLQELSKTDKEIGKTQTYKYDTNGFYKKE